MGDTGFFKSMRYQGFLVVSILNFVTSKFEPSSTVLLRHYRFQNGFGQLWEILSGRHLMILLTIALIEITF